MHKKISFKTWSLVGLSALAVSVNTLPVAKAEQPVLNVLTYSVIQDYGVDKQISALFEPQCGCKINWILDQHQYQMLNRYALTASKKNATPVDVIVGVDITSATLANSTYKKLFRPINYQVSALNNFPFAQTWNNTYAQPLTSSAVTVMYNTYKFKPSENYASFVDLINKMPFTFIFGDPRSNDLGRTLNQIIAYYGKDATQQEVLWQKIKAKTVTVGKGWSSSYGIFAKGESQAALAYSSSIIYHTLVEHKTNLQPLLIGDAVPFLVDSVLLPVKSKQPKLAEQFAKFLLTPEAQKVFFKYNSSYPVVNIDSVLSEQEQAVAKTINNYKVLDLRQLDPQAEKSALQAYIKVFVKE
ncbi:thiamine ABC transporter substrate-binding protein [Psittacicella hinzii]|nr:thiamine ABC transporter substrate-binding protein [Psittacicella hinzii]